MLLAALPNLPSSGQPCGRLAAVRVGMCLKRRHFLPCYRYPGGLFFCWRRGFALASLPVVFHSHHQGLARQIRLRKIMWREEVGYFHGGGAGRLARLVIASFFFSSSAQQRWLAYRSQLAMSLRCCPKILKLGGACQHVVTNE